MKINTGTSRSVWFRFRSTVSIRPRWRLISALRFFSRLGMGRGIAQTCWHVEQR